MRITRKVLHTVTNGTEDNGLRLNYSWYDHAMSVQNVGSGHEIGTYILYNVTSALPSPLAHCLQGL